MDLDEEKSNILLSQESKPDVDLNIESNKIRLTQDDEEVKGDKLVEQQQTKGAALLESEDAERLKMKNLDLIQGDTLHAE